MLTKRDRLEKYQALQDLRRIRIDNVRKLCGLYPSITAFAAAIAQDPSLYHAVAGENPRRSIGEALARDIERCLNLESGWLDRAHSARG